MARARRAILALVTAAGITLVAGGAFVVLGILGLGPSRCAEPGFDFYVTFPDAQGLRGGSDVTYAGVPVGEVLDLSIHQPDARAAGRVRVHVAIRDAELRVRRGDRFRVGRQGWLSHARLEIEPGEEAAEPLALGETIAGDPEPVLDAWTSRLSGYVRSLVGDEASEAAAPEPEAR